MVFLGPALRMRPAVCMPTRVGGVASFHGFCYHKMAEGQSAVDSLATEFATYTDFLDSQITPTDLYYLEVCKNNDAICIIYIHASRASESGALPVQSAS